MNKLPNTSPALISRRARFASQARDQGAGAVHHGGAEEQKGGAGGEGGSGVGAGGSGGGGGGGEVVGGGGEGGEEVGGKWSLASMAGRKMCVGGCGGGGGGLKGKPKGEPQIWGLPKKTHTQVNTRVRG